MKPKLSPPSAKTIYLVAGLIATTVALVFAVNMGAFREEAHPDPTRGSYAPLLSVIFGAFAFIITATFMFIVRFLFWPGNRPAVRALGLALLFSILLVTEAQFFGISIPRVVWSDLEAGWVVDYGPPAPQGQLPPRFPKVLHRLELKNEHDPESSRFIEFGIEGSRVFRRTGFINGIEGVETKDFDTEKSAKEAIDGLTRAAMTKGYVMATRVRHQPL